MPTAKRAKYVVYLSQNAGSQKFRALRDRLGDVQQRLIRELDYHKVKKQYGNSAPEWLNGAPCMCTCEEDPTVWQGTFALEIMSRWVQQVEDQTSRRTRRTVGGEHVEELHGSDIGRLSEQTNPAEKGMTTVMQTTDCVYGRGASVVCDSLYESKLDRSMFDKGGKISDSDIAAYARLREASVPVAERRREADGRK